jgi:hypothetical protein
MHPHRSQSLDHLVAILPQGSLDMAVQCIGPKDSDVQIMTRTRDLKELLNVPILFTIVMTAVVLFRQ